ncbi:ABC transporter substrate-binding protein, partial [Psychromonas sp.]|nr:ABC transporter substrate-binding protein [Psychromonas sp.]
PRINEDMYDPIAAKASLNALKYDFSKTLSILLPENADVFNPNFHKTAELIQANLADIGVSSEIISSSGTSLQARLISGDYDTYLTGMNIHIDDPDSIFRPLLSCQSSPQGGNSSRWCSPLVEQLMDESLTESNFAQRIKNYYQIQDEIYEKRPYLPLAHVLRLDATSASISNVEVHPLTGINFQNTIKQDVN